MDWEEWMTVSLSAATAVADQKGLIATVTVSNNLAWA
jgi:hypothetical protein